MNNEMEKYFNSFKSYLKECRFLSDDTIREYGYNIVFFFRFLVCYFNLSIIDKNVKFEDIEIDKITINIICKVTKDVIIEFLFFITSNGYSINTKLRIFFAVHSFFNFLFESKTINNIPMSSIEVKNTKKELPIYLSEQELDVFMKSIDKTSKQYIRDYTIITLIISLGLRLSEIVKLDVSDIKLDESKIFIKGKGNKERILYLNNTCKKVLKKYLVFRINFIDENNCMDKKALFLSARQKRIARRTVQYVVETTINKAGLSGKHYSCHKLRHTAATLMINSGTDINVVKEILGHSSISTTQIYTHLSDNNIKEAFTKNPLSNFKIMEGDDVYAKAN